MTEAYYRLIAWYRRRGGSLEKTTLYGMSQDNPEVTPLRLCRFDWCLTVPVDWQAESDVGMQKFPACQVAMIRCRNKEVDVRRTLTMTPQLIEQLLGRTVRRAAAPGRNRVWRH